MLVPASTIPVLAVAILRRGRCDSGSMCGAARDPPILVEKLPRGGVLVALSSRAGGRLQPAPTARTIPAGRLRTRPRRVQAAACEVSDGGVVFVATFLAPPCVALGTGDNRTMPNSESDFTLKNGVLRFNGEAKTVSTSVKGPVIHSKHREKLRKWREEVTCAVEAERGGAPWIPEDRYAVTLQFRFCRHENEILDVDNYIKPVLDGLAEGLCVDDSNFRILLIHRLPNAETPEEEGVRLFVSSTGT